VLFGGPAMTGRGRGWDSSRVSAAQSPATIGMLRRRGGRGKGSRNRRPARPGRKGSQLGVEDGPDRWAPPVSRRKREKAGRWWSGLLGRKWGAGPR
jgi:hypothetical protein